MFKLIALLLLCTGCGTLINETDPRTRIEGPVGAHVTVYDMDDALIAEGMSPIRPKLETGAGYFTKAEYRVVLSRGAEECTYYIKAKFSAWYLGNFALIGVGGIIGSLLIDPLTGGMFRLEDLYVYSMKGGPDA